MSNRCKAKLNNGKRCRNSSGDNGLCGVHRNWQDGGEGSLNAKQERFIAEYLVDLNATQAAIRAGYSKKTADRQGHRLLKKAEIAAAVSERRSEMIAKLEITQESVAQELAKLGFSNMADYLCVTPDGDPYLDLSDLTRDQSAAISEVTVEDYTEGRGRDARNVRRVKTKLADKKSALVALGKLLGLEEPARHEHSGPGGSPLVSVVERVIVDPKTED